MESINIYGVAVPGMGGRCGMAAILMQPDQTFDGRVFYEFAAGCLPRYAMPQFVRLPAQADLTTTFKLRKVDLQRQGYDPRLLPIRSTSSTRLDAHMFPTARKHWPKAAPPPLRHESRRRGVPPPLDFHGGVSA